jgi:hypothetical protein
MYILFKTLNFPREQGNWTLQGYDLSKNKLKFFNINYFILLLVVEISNMQEFCYLSLFDLNAVIFCYVQNQHLTSFKKPEIKKDLI